MPLHVAEEISQLCAHQKDDYYINSLRGLLHSNLKNIFGNSFLLTWDKEIIQIADVIYYCLTTVGSLQTLGEEYTNLIQVESSLRETPSLYQRLLMVLLHTVVPYCIEKFLTRVEKKLMFKQMHMLSDENQARLLTALPKIKLLIVTIHRLHLSIFYLKGIYFTMAKRHANIKYVKYVTSVKKSDNSFSLLGKCSVVQSVLMLSLQLCSLFNELTACAVNSKSGSSPSHFLSQTKPGLEIEKQKCALCLEVRQHTSLTTCGHLFCWSCIQEWIHNKPECPLCREELSPNKIVLLKNYA